MLYLNSRAQMMKAVEGWETLKCLDQDFACHVDNQCYKSYTHPKNLKKPRLVSFTYNLPLLGKILQLRKIKVIVFVKVSGYKFARF